MSTISDTKQRELEIHEIKKIQMKKKITSFEIKILIELHFVKFTYQRYMVRLILLEKQDQFCKY